MCYVADSIHYFFYNIREIYKDEITLFHFYLLPLYYKTTFFYY